MPAGDRTLTSLAELFRTHRAHRRSRWRRLKPGQQALLVADDKPYYPGERHRHGVNVQFRAVSAGRLVWASPTLPGAVLDLTAARQVGLIDALTRAAVPTFADLGYQGAGGALRTPFKRHRHRPRLSCDQNPSTAPMPASERSAKAPRRP